MIRARKFHAELAGIANGYEVIKPPDLLVNSLRLSHLLLLSIFVPKFLILLVRQVRKFDILLMLCRVPVPSSIHQYIVQQENDCHRDGGGVHRNNSDLRGYVLRRVFVAEREWTEDVTETETHQDKRVGCHFLGVALGMVSLWVLFDRE